jgi:hypothetical protein
MQMFYVSSFLRFFQERVSYPTTLVSTPVEVLFEPIAN